MIPYLFPIYFLFLSWIMSHSVDRKSSVVVLITAVTFVIFFSGFRYFSDTDYLAYYSIFNSLPTINNLNYNVFTDTYGEPGYLFVNVLTKSMGLPFFFVTLFASLVSIGAKSFVAYKYSKSAFLVFSSYLCMHFVTTEFSELRWSISTGFLVLGIYNHAQKNKSLSLLLFLVATAFHYSSILVIFIVLIAKYLSKKSSIMIFFISLIFAFSFKFIPTGFQLDLNTNLFILSRFQRYVNDIDSNVGFISLFKLLFYFLLIYTVSFIKTRSFSFYLNENLKDFEGMLYLLMSAALLLSIVPIFFLRLAPLFDFFALIVVFNVVDKLTRLESKIFVKSVCILLFGLWFLISLPRSLDVPVSEGGLGEYRTVLDELI